MAVLGLIGARLYHVMTPSPSMAAVGIYSWRDYLRYPLQLLNFRAGGLGIYGGMAGGLLAIFIYTRRNRISTLAWADLAVVGAALGQAIGRWGNFFNQELYGRPTNAPWAIAIDPLHRLPDYADFSTFHPAFLYESLWSLLTFFVLLWLARRRAERLLPGELLALYLVAYAIGRSLLELVRLDSRAVPFLGLETGLAVATLVSLIVAAVAVAAVVVRRLRHRGGGGAVVG
jgi:phosphatidylglycerol:prolipoprotein diacylglycerol transferase